MTSYALGKLKPKEWMWLLLAVGKWCKITIRTLFLTGNAMKAEQLVNSMAGMGLQFVDVDIESSMNVEGSMNSEVSKPQVKEKGKETETETEIVVKKAVKRKRRGDWRRKKADAKDRKWEKGKGMQMEKVVVVVVERKQEKVKVKGKQKVKKAEKEKAKELQSLWEVTADFDRAVDMVAGDSRSTRVIEASQESIAMVGDITTKMESNHDMTTGS
ncbi:hypothetical protein J3R82DRAFT_1886 [Butyriboletus roseoflavus]|nr:hypothetical protein J3R82DRAFT_1886 [Butyriboletus roseoflavus]